MWPPPPLESRVPLSTSTLSRHFVSSVPPETLQYSMLPSDTGTANKHNTVVCREQNTRVRVQTIQWNGAARRKAVAVRLEGRGEQSRGLESAIRFHSTSPPRAFRVLFARLSAYYVYECEYEYEYCFLISPRRFHSHIICRCTSIHMYSYTRL